MTAGNITAVALLAMLAAYVAIIWIVLARRRRARVGAVRLALSRAHKAGGAWDRLGKSSAGAP